MPPQLHEKLDDILQRLQEETANCPPLLRLQIAELRGELTEEERRHIASCRYCQITQRKVHELCHPTLWELLLYIADELPEDKAQYVRYHLKREGCYGCRKLLDSPWLRRFAEAVRTGKRTTEQVKKYLEELRVIWGGVEPLPMPIASFAPRDRTPFHQRVEQPDVAITLHEAADTGELLAFVEARDETLFNHTVHVELLGENERLTADVLLNRRLADGRCIGSHSFGAFKECADNLGNRYQIIAIIERPAGSHVQMRW